MGRTCQPFLLMLGLFFSVERVECPRRAIREKRRELLRLQLLLDAMELTAAGWHCGENKEGEKTSALVFGPSRGHRDKCPRALTDFASPLPAHSPLTCSARLVEVTGSTSGLIDHSRGLLKTKAIAVAQFHLSFIHHLNLCF